MNRIARSAVSLSLILAAVDTIAAQPPANVPKASDPRLVVELVAAAPDIVHPIACDVDAKGRLLVIESHTHFAPKDYKGPKLDRIQAFDLSKRGKPTTFFEGTRHTMDLAVHPDGSVYIATRNEILRLRETKGTGIADEKTRIVFLDTKGDYPHNGLSGLCFDSRGDLYFGMGENLGAFYTLIGADGIKISGEGDGGHIFHCTAEGKKLRKIATGFWNPFGICRDIFDRVFAVDNDPDESPPCRMVHVVEGGDYGFQFRYGRSGKHPFQSWHGELPGTLPMMTGVGEAPCEILSYESDGLPAEYRGQLLVTSWADHRVERYAVKPHGASFKAERLPFVQGGNNFRPVGLCVAPDGSLFVTDWVLPNYELHGKGAIWHIRWKDAPKAERPSDPKQAIFSMHRPLREAAARKLAKNDKEQEFLQNLLGHRDVRVRAAVLQALLNGGPNYAFAGLDLSRDPDVGMRELALPAVVDPNFFDRLFKNKNSSAILRAEALRTALFSPSGKALLGLLSSDDPFMRQAAIQRIVRNGYPFILDKELDARQRAGVVLADRAIFTAKADPLFAPVADEAIQRFLKNPDEDVRFLTLKWIADDNLKEFRAEVEKLMQEPKLSVRMYLGCATALARFDGKEVNEKSLADYFAKRLEDATTPPATRAMLLRQVPATHPKLTIRLLTRLLKADDADLKLEAVRALAEHPSSRRDEPLLDVLRNPKLGPSIRGFAMLGLNDRRLELRDELIAIAKAEARLQGDVDRALAARVPPQDRPPAKDVDVWLKRLEGKADADTGARVFYHPRVGCAACHRIDGRGKDVGPDLSRIGTVDRRSILESILQPSNTVAPHYVAWRLETAAGKVLSGMLVHTNLDEYTFVDAKGERFKVKTGDLVEQTPTAQSIMPDGLVDTMTDQELRDLLAYLASRK